MSFGVIWYAKKIDEKQKKGGTSGRPQKDYKETAGNTAPQPETRSSQQIAEELQFIRSLALSQLNPAPLYAVLVSRQGEIDSFTGSQKAVAGDPVIRDFGLSMYDSHT